MNKAVTLMNHRLDTVYFTYPKSPDCKIKFRKKIFGFKSQELVAVFVLGFYTMFILCFLIFDYEKFHIDNLKDQIISYECFYFISSLFLAAYYAFVCAEVFVKITEAEEASPQ